MPAFVDRCLCVSRVFSLVLSQLYPLLILLSEADSMKKWTEEVQ